MTSQLRCLHWCACAVCIGGASLVGIKYCALFLQEEGDSTLRRCARKEEKVENCLKSEVTER